VFPYVAVLFVVVLLDVEVLLVVGFIVLVVEVELVVGEVFEVVVVAPGLDVVAAEVELETVGEVFAVVVVVFEVVRELSAVPTAAD
jgi:hypothetical protein